MRPVDLARPYGLSGQAIRNYEAAGILPAAARTPSGYRDYTPDDIRDAHLVRQLRRSGYLLAQIAPLLDELRHARSPASAASALADRRTRLHARALAMLRAAAEVDRHLQATT